MKDVFNRNGNCTLSLKLIMIVVLSELKKKGQKLDF